MKDQIAAEFNSANPRGTRVRVRSITRNGVPLSTALSGPAFVSRDGTVLVWVQDWYAPIWIGDLEICTE